jgi:hypothetical protein
MLNVFTNIKIEYSHHKCVVTYINFKIFTFILSRKEFAYGHVVLKNARMVDAEWIHLKITTTLFA